MTALLEERCAWRSHEIGDSSIWELTDADRAELGAALEQAEARTDDDEPEVFRLTATTETWWKAAHATP